MTDSRRFPAPSTVEKVAGVLHCVRRQVDKARHVV